VTTPSGLQYRDVVVGTGPQPSSSTATVRVNDRGPFIRGRILDVTEPVAHDLGFHHKGLTQVRIEVLSVGDGPYRIR
jgi:rare lipoprotein A